MVGLKLSFVFIFQGWVLLMSNASFALGVATEIIRILFLSGYGMVNFVFGVAVYFSALFYLVKYAKYLFVEGGGTRLQACGGHLELRTSGRGRIRQRSKQGRQ